MLCMFRGGKKGSIAIFLKKFLFRMFSVHSASAYKKKFCFVSDLTSMCESEMEQSESVSGANAIQATSSSPSLFIALMTYLLKQEMIETAFSSDYIELGSEFSVCLKKDTRGRNDPIG